MLHIVNKRPIFVDNIQQNEIEEKHNLPKAPENYGAFRGKY